MSPRHQTSIPHPAQEDGAVDRVHISLPKHMGDSEVKVGRGPYDISTAILSMYAGF